jgi:hypothetical protein
MKRSYEPFDLVQLPRLDATGAQALGTEVLTIAKTKDLSEPVAESLTELAVAHRALVALAADRLPTTKPDPAASKAADAALDASWRALFDVIGGWSKLPNHAQATLAASLRSQLFPDGLQFLKLAYKLEWAESNSRLLLIKNRRLEAAIEELGAGSILKTLREAHKTYGQVLGITQAKQAEQDTTGIRDRLGEFATALRRYIVRVAASVKTKDESTAKLAVELLSPIQDWESTGRTPPVDVEPPPEPVPTPPEPVPTPPEPVPTPPEPVPTPPEPVPPVQAGGAGTAVR